MSDKMKVRDGKDGYSYPYTSPDLVIDKDGKSNTSKFNEIDSQFKDIANYGLIIGEDGKAYLMNEKGVKFGTGIKFPSDVDLSKVTMSMNGQTLKLLNDGTQIATVEIPTAVVTDEQLTSIIQSKIDDGTITSIALGENSVATANLQDNSVTIDKIDFMNYKLINLFDINAVTKGLCSDRGVESPDSNSNYGYTALIPVEPGDTIYYSNSYKVDFPTNVWISVYDKNKTVITPSGITPSMYNNDAYTYYFTVPENVYFIRFGRLYTYATSYTNFIVSKEPHSYSEGILYGTEENVVFNIDEKYKHYIYIKN